MIYISVWCSKLTNVQSMNVWFFQPSSLTVLLWEFSAHKAQYRAWVLPFESTSRIKWMYYSFYSNSKTYMFDQHFESMQIKESAHVIISCTLSLHSLPYFFSSTCQNAKYRKKIYIYSNKFIHNFHLSESSFICPRLWA